MRLAASTLTLLAVLAGCAAAPDPATLPHGTVTDSHVEVDGDRTDTFRVLEVDGRRVLDLGDQPARKIGHDFSNLVVAGRPVRLHVEGFAFYGNTVRRMFWDPMRAEGNLEFVPTAGARYVLRGSVTPELSTVWLEDVDTHAQVGNKLSVPGRAASAPGS